jgi:hypothetical protein
MNKQTISAGFIALSCVDIVALSQFSLSLWEAAAFGIPACVCYGLGLFAAFAE